MDPGLHCVQAFIMGSHKLDSHTAHGYGLDQPASPNAYHDGSPDQRDMWRMGKVQELQVCGTRHCNGLPAIEMILLFPSGVTRRLITTWANMVQRYFGPWTMIGFASILGCAWQYVLITMPWSVVNGGPAGAVYMYLLCCVGLMLSTLSLAEMASM